MKRVRLSTFSLLLPALLAGCGDKPVPPQAKLPVVLAFQVRLGNGANQAEYSGEVRPRHEAALGFRVAGKLIARRVDVGDRVAPGAELARLDPGDLAQSQQAAEAQIASTRAGQRFAAADLERYRGLYAEKFVSQAALDAKTTALRSAEEQVRATTAQGAIAGHQVDYARLASDQAGVVTAVLAEPGQVLAAGQPVVRIARTDEKEVLIAVPENRLAELAGAGEVVVSLWAVPGKRYRGRVREVAPQADAVTRTYAARVTVLDADANVRLGQTARVDLAPGKAGVVTLVPAGAVFQQGDRPAVWQIEGDRVHLRPVSVSAWREDGVAVSGGLAEGERIVAAGAHKLFENAQVRVTESHP
jgi:RND family efflux transporter MFP subunit